MMTRRSLSYVMSIAINSTINYIRKGINSFYDDIGVEVRTNFVLLIIFIFIVQNKFTILSLTDWYGNNKTGQFVHWIEMKFMNVMLRFLYICNPFDFNHLTLTNNASTIRFLSFYFFITTKVNSTMLYSICFSVAYVSVK